jgi:phage baseplate assembly protein W
MADSTGVNAATGKPLSDWDHVQQSIRKILTTPIGARVMRRDFGSDLPDLIDAKMTRKNILAAYSAAAAAIAKWEPRFRMRSGRVDRAGYLTTEDGRIVRSGPGGIVSIAILGTYFPRGHLGDYSIAESASTRIIFGG